MDKQKEKLKQMLESERQKVKGYEQIAQVHSAYISILLMKLGATKGNEVTITFPEVKEAMEKYETRAVHNSFDDSWKIYCEIVE